jgi:hypothetical protein
VISHRFVVDGGQDDVRSWVEIRCTVCGKSELFGENGDSASLHELTVWAEAHKCRRGLHTNTTGRSTDRETNGIKIHGTMTGRLTDRKPNGPHVMMNALVQADHVARTQMFSRSPFEWDMTPLDTYVDNLVDEFRSKKPKEK